LQSRAETDQNTAGTLSRAELVTQVQQLLSNSTQNAKFAEKLIAALTSRVLCLVERQTGHFEFEVQSLREYFAALHIYEEAPPQGGANSRDDCLSALVERPYWSNVMRFLVGMLSKGEVKALVENLRSRQQNPDARLDPYLRWVAAQFLDDRIYENQPDTQIAWIVDFILDGRGVVFGEDGLLDASGLPILFTEQAGARQVVEHARRRLREADDVGLQRQLATLLLRHSTDEEDQDWAWESVSEEITETELVLLSDVAAFNGCDASQTSRLVRALERVEDRPGGEVLALLARGRYDGNDSRLMSLVLADVLDGAAERVTYRGVMGHQSPLRAALAVGRLEPLVGLPQLDIGGIPVPSRGRTRHRRRRGEPVEPNALECLNAWRNADKSMRGDRTEAAWKALVTAIQAASPDSWLLRVVLTFAGLEFDLSLGSDPALDTDATWRLHAAWVRAAIEHSSDLTWWTAHDQRATGLPGRHWLLAASCIAGTEVVLELLPALDKAVETLPAGEFEALQIAAHRWGSRPSARKLNLLLALRRDVVKVGPRTAALLTCRGEPDANEYLNRMIVDGLLPLTDPGSAPAAVLRTAVYSSKAAVDLSALKGARTAFPAGSLRHLPARPIPIGLAREVLTTPEAWPADIVTLAARRVALKRSGTLPPVADVAAADNWFDQG